MSKRLVLFILVGLLAGVLGFVTLPPARAVLAVRDFGFWWIVAALIGLAYYGGREGWRRWHVPAQTRPKWDKWAVVVVVVGAAFLHVHEPFGFKLVADEVLLSSTAKQLHDQREAATILRAYDYAGNFVPLNTRVDKRPLTFPVLLALLHGATGYRFENVFVLNGMLSLALTGLLFVVGRRLAGFWGGTSAVAWICTIPLVAQNATGAGFELLNLVMILLTLWLGMRFAEEPGDTDRIGSFLMAAVLLAQVRYESALFILPVGATILYGWWRLGRVFIPGSLLATPLLLLLVPWQQNVFRINEASWQLEDIAGATSPFGLHYLYANVGHAFNFFFSFDGSQPNSWMLGVLGPLAIGFVVLLVYKEHRVLFRNRPAHAVYIITFFGLLLHAAVMLCYFWGRWDDPIIRRLSLPTHLLLILSVVFIWGTVSALNRRWGWLLCLAALQIIGWSIPAMARQGYNAENPAARTVNWIQDFAQIQTAAGRQVLAIDPAADLMWFLHNQSAITPYLLARRVEEFCYHFERDTFDDVFVVQRLGLDLATGEQAVSVDHELGTGVKLETLAERTFAPAYVIRISRVISIDREALLSWGKHHQNVETGEVTGSMTVEIKPDEDGLREWMRNLP